MSNKPFREMPKILPRDALDAKDDIVVVPVIEYERGRPVQTIAVAARVDVGQPDESCVLVGFHFGRARWGISREYVHAQKATSWENYGLEHALAEFERITGQEVPAIKVVEPGTGIYAASRRHHFDNPWALKDGMVYQTVNRQGQVRNFEAHVNNGMTRVAQLDEHGQRSGQEFHDPRLIFSDVDWKSLKQIDLEQDAPTDEEDAPAPGM